MINNSHFTRNVFVNKNELVKIDRNRIWSDSGKRANQITNQTTFDAALFYFASDEMQLFLSYIYAN